MNNGHSRIVTPGQTNVGIQLIVAPLATPAPFMMQTPAGLQMAVVGGLSKLEHAAIAIAANKRSPTTSVHTEDRGELFGEEALAYMSALRAEAVLAECARRQASE